MLKFTGQKLQLLHDYDMLLMFENGQYIIFKNEYIYNNLIYFYRYTWRTSASKRYAKANNVKTPGYDETKKKS